MTVSQVIAELRAVEKLFGDIPLDVTVEKSSNRRNCAILARGFMEVFTNVTRGEGRVCCLRLETEKAAKNRDGHP